MLPLSPYDRILWLLYESYLQYNYYTVHCTHCEKKIVVVCVKKILVKSLETSWPGGPLWRPSSYHATVQWFYEKYFWQDIFFIESRYNNNYIWLPLHHHDISIWKKQLFSGNFRFHVYQDCSSANFVKKWEKTMF